MHALEKSHRIKNIESKFEGDIKDLLYRMHWAEDMKHRDIGLRLGVPRSTVTKWFYHFGVPTQSCRRFTDKNLIIRKKKPNKTPSKPPQAAKKEVNTAFFKRWSSEMAYVLGYFAADGCMFINPRGSRYVSFSSTDREILEKVRMLLNSKHKIALRKRRNDKWKDSFTLQIGSKEMYSDLLKLGFTPNKEFRLKLPDMPRECFRHFVRGYFDGDGCITSGCYIRKDRHNKKYRYILTGFAYANLDFLRKLSEALMESASMGKGHLDKKGDHLYYSKRDSIKLFNYMYTGASKEQYLERKYNKFQEAFGSSH